MTAKLLTGKPLAEKIRDSVKIQVTDFSKNFNRSPKLVVIHTGNDPASEVYVRNKKRSAKKVGIESEIILLPETTSSRELETLIEKLNNDSGVDGILVQLPLPSHLDSDSILLKVDPRKDVDGFHPVNIGMLWNHTAPVAPCTPAGIMELLKYYQIEISGKNAVIVGRSRIVGKPIAALLLKENATVTIAHSKTKNLKKVCKEADILIAAIGRPAFLDKNYIQTGAVVIDVGINRVTEDELTNDWADQISDLKEVIAQKGYALIGDINPCDAMNLASFYTPVPGGVGLLTVAMLMRNTITLAINRMS